MATASRLLMIGTLVKCYVEDFGAMPRSNEALRRYEPNLPYDVVFCFDDAVAPLLRLTEDSESGYTPCIWFAADFTKDNAERQIVAIKRVDIGKRRDRLVVLFGDLSVKYFTIGDSQRLVTAARAQNAPADDGGGQRLETSATSEPSAPAASP